MDSKTKLELPEILGDPNGVNIRPISKEDIPELLEWMNNPMIQATLVSGEAKTFEEDKLLKEIESLSESAPKGITYTVYLKDRIIGRVRLQNINWSALNASGSLFIGPVADLRGKGYGSQAAKLRTELAKKIGLKTLYSRVFENNIPQIKIMQKVGYKEVGRYHNYAISNGELSDAIFFEKSLS